MDIDILIEDLDTLVAIAREDKCIGITRWLGLNNSATEIKQMLETLRAKKAINSPDHFICPSCGEVTIFPCEGGIGDNNCSYCGQKIVLD